MYDILVYLFENCQHNELARDRARVAKKLSAAGFDASDISETLSWLAGGARSMPSPLPPRPIPGAAYRTYASKELARLDAECRGLLIQLEQSGILTPQQREHVIERSLAANGDALMPEQLKLIVLMVLWNEEIPSSRLIVEELLSLPAARVPS